MTTDDSKTLNADEDYGFDVAGFLHVRDVPPRSSRTTRTPARDGLHQRAGDAGRRFSGDRASGLDWFTSFEFETNDAKSQPFGERRNPD